MPFHVNAAKVVEAKAVVPMVVDPCGVFRVTVDRDAGELVAVHYATEDAKEPSCAIRACMQRRLWLRFCGWVWFLGWITLGIWVVSWRRLRQR